MTQRDNSAAHDPQVNPWHPMNNPVDLKHLGKLMEELGECQAAAARCIIQGIDERDPETEKLNSVWLKEEIADVIANIQLVVYRFNLNRDDIDDRVERKKRKLVIWHEMA